MNVRGQTDRIPIEQTASNRLPYIKILVWHFSCESLAHQSMKMGCVSI